MKEPRLHIWVFIEWYLIKSVSVCLNDIILRNSEIVFDDSTEYSATMNRSRCLRWAIGDKDEIVSKRRIQASGIEKM